MGYSLLTYWSWEFTCCFSYTFFYNFWSLQKSSFSKFDQLSKKTILHVRSVDASKVQKQFNQVRDALWRCLSSGMWQCVSVSGAFFLDRLTLKMKSAWSLKHHELLVWCSVISQKPGDIPATVHCRRSWPFLPSHDNWDSYTTLRLQSALMWCTQIGDCQCRRKTCCLIQARGL